MNKCIRDILVLDYIQNYVTSRITSDLGLGTKYFHYLSGLVAGDSAICGRLAAQNSAIAVYRFVIWGFHQEGPF